MQGKKRNQRIFIIGFLLFVSVVIFLAIDMASRTTAPWNKPKQLERALPRNSDRPDSLVVDSLLLAE